MKKILIGLLVLGSFSSWAHNMPRDVKIKKIMTELGKLLPDTAIESISEDEILITNSTYNFTLRAISDRLSKGDQDIQEFFIEYSKNNMSFELNCRITTTEIELIDYPNIANYILEIDSCTNKNLTKNIKKKFLALHTLSHGISWSSFKY